jgi:hypothetical protein
MVHAKELVAETRQNSRLQKQSKQNELYAFAPKPGHLQRRIVEEGFGTIEDGNSHGRNCISRPLSESREHSPPQDDPSAR